MRAFTLIFSFLLSQTISADTVTMSVFEGSSNAMISIFAGCQLKMVVGDKKQLKFFQVSESISRFPISTRPVALAPAYEYTQVNSDENQYGESLIVRFDPVETQLVSVGTPFEYEYSRGRGVGTVYCKDLVLQKSRQMNLPPQAQ
jgi:hypothetical protein